MPKIRITAQMDDGSKFEFVTNPLLHCPNLAYVAAMLRWLGDFVEGKNQTPEPRPKDFQREKPDR